MGQGLPWPAPAMTPWATMFDLPRWTADESHIAMAQHWYLDGFQAPDPVEISWTWLSGPMRFRQDKPFTHAAVSKEGAGTAVAQTSSGQRTPFTATLAARNDADAPNLAHFTVTYYDEPRTRLAEVALILNTRTDEEIWTILGVEIGTRIQLVDLPDGWPQGADSLVVEGIAHSSSADLRVVTWSTSPVVGEEPGAVGPFFRVGVSAFESADVIGSSPTGGDDKLPW